MQVANNKKTESFVFPHFFFYPVDKPVFQYFCPVDKTVFHYLGCSLKQRRCLKSAYIKIPPRHELLFTFNIYNSKKLWISRDESQ